MDPIQAWNLWSLWYSSPSEDEVNAAAAQVAGAGPAQGTSGPTTFTAGPTTFTAGLGAGIAAGLLSMLEAVLWVVLAIAGILAVMYGGSLIARRYL